MSIDIKHKNTESKSKHLIVFIHGLGGSISSFENNKEKLFHEYLDELILMKCDIGYYKYTTKIISSKWKSLMSNVISFIGKEVNHNISEIAELLKTEYIYYKQEYETINFICHSMGGLIVKELLLNKGLSFKSKPFYITLATPHLGSDIANKLIIINDKHEHIKSLKTDSKALVQLNTKFIEKKEQFNRKYYYAMDDGIVSKDSSCSEGEESLRTAVKGNHISICKPDGETESQILLNDINREIKVFLNIRDAGAITIAQSNEKSLALFDSFSIDKKPYYLDREIDQSIKSSLSNKNIWIYGESGVGKTNSAQYYFITNEREFSHSTYFTSTQEDIEIYLQHIYESLIDRVDDSELNIVDTLSINEKLAKVLCYLSRKYKNTTLHLDEFPNNMGDEKLKEFFVFLVDILTNVRDDCELENINFIITTLFNPVTYVELLENPSHKEKMKSQFDFVSIEKWANEDLLKLNGLITEKLGIEINGVETKVEEFHGKPRALKEFLKNEIADKED